MKKLNKKKMKHAKGGVDAPAPAPGPTTTTTTTTLPSGTIVTTTCTGDVCTKTYKRITTNTH